MRTEFWTRIQALFAEVADLPAARRAERLTSECDGEPGLRRQVEALVRADQAAGDGAFIRRVVKRGMTGLADRPADDSGRRRARPDNELQGR